MDRLATTLTATEDVTARRDPAPADAVDPGTAPPGHRRIGSVEILAVLLVLLVVFRNPLAALVSAPGLQTWTTVFVSVLVQAVPFLVFGVVLSAVIAVFVPRSFWARALPRHPALAVPAAGLLSTSGSGHPQFGGTSGVRARLARSMAV